LAQRNRSKDLRRTPSFWVGFGAWIALAITLVYLGEGYWVLLWGMFHFPCSLLLLGEESYVLVFLITPAYASVAGVLCETLTRFLRTLARGLVSRNREHSRMSPTDLRRQELPSEEEPASATASAAWQFSLQTLLLSVALFWSALAAFGVLGLAIVAFAMVFLVWLRAVWPPAGSEIIRMTAVVFAGSIVFFWLCVMPRTDKLRIEGCKADLEYIRDALQQYHEKHGCYPPAYLAGADGKPMHSWRVLILPNLRMQDLYDKYDFKEPWNGPNNRKLATSRAADIYWCRDADRGTGMTNYLAVEGPEAAWPGSRSLARNDLEKEGADTILLVEMRPRGRVLGRLPETISRRKAPTRSCWSKWPIRTFIGWSRGIYRSRRPPAGSIRTRTEGFPAGTCGIADTSIMTRSAPTLPSPAVGSCSCRRAFLPTGSKGG